MKRTDRVARKTQTLLPGTFGRVGSILFNPTYEYVVNGFIIDGTSYKNTVVAKRLQHVFFEADPSLRLTLSKPIYNLADPSRVTHFCGNLNELASQIATTLISSGAATEMLQPYTLRDFLNQHFPGDLPSHYEDGHLFELCCAAFLSGDTRQARAGFALHKAKWDAHVRDHGGAGSPYWEDRRREADEVAALLDGSDDALRQHILGNVARNAALLGFQAVGAGPAPATPAAAAVRVTPPSGCPPAGSRHRGPG